MFTLSLEGLRPYRRGVPQAGVFAERFILRRGFISQRSGNKPRNRINNQHRRKLPAAQYIISDGNFFGGEVFGHPLIHSFVPPAQEHDTIQLCIASCVFLPEKCSCGRQQNDGRFWILEGRLLGTAKTPPKQRFDSLEKRLGFEHHPLAAAKRPVINATVPILGEHTQVLYLHLYEASLASSPQDAMTERARKKIWKDCNEVETHLQPV